MLTLYSTSISFVNTCSANTCKDLKSIYVASECCNASSTFLDKKLQWDDLPAQGTLVKGSEMTTLGYSAVFNETTGEMEIKFTSEENEPACFHPLSALRKNPGCSGWVGANYERRLMDFPMMTAKIFVPDLAAEELKPYVCEGDYEEDGYLKNPTITTATKCTTTVKLRQDLRWSDGHPITAHDYTYWEELHARMMANHADVVAPMYSQFSVTAEDEYTLKFTSKNRNSVRPTAMFYESMDWPLPRHFWSQYDSNMDTLFSENNPYPPVTTHIEYDPDKTIWPDKTKNFERLVFKVNRESPAYRQKYWKICFDTMNMTVQEGSVTHHLGGGCPFAKTVLEGPHVDYISFYPISDYRSGIPYFNANFFHTFSGAFFRQGMAPDNQLLDPSDNWNQWARNWAWNQDIKNKVITGDFSIASPTIGRMANTLQYNHFMWPTKSLAFRQAITCLVDKRKYGMTRMGGHQHDSPVFGTVPDVSTNEVPTYAERLCFDKNENERHVLAIELLKQEGWTADNWNVETALGETNILLPGEESISSSLGSTKGMWGITPPQGLRAPDGTPVSEFANELYAWYSQPATVPYGQMLTRFFNQLGVPTTLKTPHSLDNFNVLRRGLCGNYSTWKQTWKDKFSHLPKWSGNVLLWGPAQFKNYYSSETWAYGKRISFVGNCERMPTVQNWDNYGQETLYAAFRAQNQGWSHPELDRLNDFFRLHDSARGGKTEEANQKMKRIREIMNEHQLVTLLDASPNAGTMYRNLVLPDEDWKNEMGPLDDRFVKITNANGKSFNDDKPTIVPMTFDPTDYGVEEAPTIVSPPPSPPAPPPLSPGQTAPLLFVSELEGNRKVKPGVYIISIEGVSQEIKMTFTEDNVDVLWTDDTTYPWPYQLTGSCIGTYSYENFCNAAYTLKFPVDACTNVFNYTSGCGLFGTNAVNTMRLDTSGRRRHLKMEMPL